MSKVKPTTKEQLIHYLLHNVSLGSYDNRFLSNIEINFIGAGKPVTTNQAELLNKITIRYARQLAKQELDANQLVQLLWKKEPINSAPEYTTAYAQLDNGKIVIRTPYKTTFIKELRNINTSDWNKDKREWTVNYNELNLKKIVTLIADNYELINFCDDIKHMISVAEQYEHIKVWNPTLCEVSGKLLIAGINEYLHESIIDIPLEKTPLCFSKLATYGVEIDKSLFIDDVLKFASNTRPEIEKSQLTDLIELLPLIGCEAVVLSVKHSFSSLLMDLVIGLKEKNIEIVTKSNVSNNTLKNYVVICPAHTMNTAIEIRADKVIQVVNSTPVAIK